MIHIQRLRTKLSVSTAIAIASLVLSSTNLFGGSYVAQAAPVHYLVCDASGGGDCLGNAAHGSIVETSNNDSYTFTNQTTWAGHTVYLMRIGGGSLCLNWLYTNSYVYADSCIAGDKNELWWHDGNWLVNAAATDYYNDGNAYMTAVALSPTAQVAVNIGGTASKLNQWILTPAE